MLSAQDRAIVKSTVPLLESGGEALITEDRPGHSMFVVVDGDFEVTIKGDADALAKLEKGAVVGEMSLLTGTPRSATVTAVREGEVLEVDKAALANVLWMSPGLVDRFVDMLVAGKEA